jgi:hypothetical protein
MKIFLFVFVSLCVSVAMLLLVKNEITYQNYMKISEAIHNYVLDTKDFYGMGFYDDMKDYGRTVLTIWDWGYKHILPPDKFELIKPYIKK